MKHQHSDIERLRHYGAATVHEALGGIGAMDAALKPLDPTTRLAGPALTVDCAPGDNLTLQYAASIAKPGDVLVVDAKAYTNAGPWGDVLTLYAQQIGIAGLVIDGSVRDSQDIREMGFPTFSRGICIKGTGKFNPGKVNVPILCGGAPVSPGDLIVGDADGVTVVPAHAVGEALQLAEARERKEAEFREALRRGESLVDLMGLRPKLDALGLPPTNLNRD
jgi:4-hydroxy-4-methyl-2-oxoglutarate aldolase